MCSTEEAKQLPHKNEEGTYVITFYDKFGRHIKDKDVIRTTLSDSITDGNFTLSDKPEEFSSFVVKRTLYNSVQHPNSSSLKF